MIWIFAVAVCAATLVGGWFALRHKDRLHLILGLSAGAVLGVAFFDLMPEAIRFGGIDNLLRTVGFVAIGFVVYMILDRFIVLHSHHDDSGHDHERKGILGASSLSVHSLLDGVAIGVSFQVSHAAGLVIALAVLAHDFSDGMNTVNVVLRNGGTARSAFRFLIVDALAPVLGIIVTCFFTLPQSVFGIVLAIFAGFFFYIGASDLLPESHHQHPTFWTTAMTMVGMAFLFLVIKIAG